MCVCVCAVFAHTLMVLRVQRIAEVNASLSLSFLCAGMRKQCQAVCSCPAQDVCLSAYCLPVLSLYCPHKTPVFIVYRLPPSHVHCAVLYCLLRPPMYCAGDGKQLAGAMDKMKNMAVKRDSMRKSFIEDKATAKAMAPVPNEEDAEEDDLSSYL